MSGTSVAVFTLTRDRLAYTERAFAALKERAGMPFRHYVVDNGSTDGTADWLLDRRTEFEGLIILPENAGIGAAGNLALEAIERDGGADFTVKMDNDCEVRTPGLLATMVDLYRLLGEYAPVYVLSPRVKGIVNQQTRRRQAGAGGHPIGITTMVGGLFLMAPRRAWSGYRFPADLPKARGYDSAFCHAVRTRGGECGYVEDLVVEHMDTTEGQARRFPAYFEQKWKEER